MYFSFCSKTLLWKSNNITIKKVSELQSETLHLFVHKNNKNLHFFTNFICFSSDFQNAQNTFSENSWHLCNLRYPDSYAIWDILKSAYDGPCDVYDTIVGALSNLCRGIVAQHCRQQSTTATSADGRNLILTINKHLEYERSNSGSLRDVRSRIVCVCLRSLPTWVATTTPLWATRPSRGRSSRTWETRELLWRCTKYCNQGARWEKSQYKWARFKTWKLECVAVSLFESRKQWNIHGLTVSPESIGLFHCCPAQPLGVDMFSRYVSSHTQKKCNYPRWRGGMLLGRRHLRGRRPRASISEHGAPGVDIWKNK